MTRRTRAAHPPLMAAYATIALFLFAGLAHGQEFATPTIVTEGTASVTVEPDTAAFRFTKRFTGATMKEAAAAAKSFESDLRDALSVAELSAGEVTAGAVAFLEGSDTEVERRAEVRFSIGDYDTAEDRAAFVANLIDSLTAVAKSTDTAMRGPYLAPASRETAEQAAVSRATENALFRADAIAALIEGQIFSVVKAHVIDVTWGESEENWAFGAGTVKEMQCNARVEVTYTVGG